MLHDARLVTGAYDAQMRELRLTFDCLRRHTDGSAMQDRNVTLHLAGITAVTAAYDPLWPKDRPSQFRLPDDACISRLVPWPLPSAEVEVSVDSATSAESLELAAHREVLVETSGEDAGRLLCLHSTVGKQHIPLLLAIRCASVRPFANGQPFSLDAWAAEFAAWWTSWNEYWNEQTEAAEDAPPISSENGVGLDRSYAPPDLPAFEAERTEVPEALLFPIRTWFEAGLTLDAARRVSVSRNLDETTDDQVALEQAWMTVDDYGSWDYAREIEGWWMEGNRAYVGIVGMMHFMPIDGEPADDVPSRWSFALRRRGDVWQIHRHMSSGDDALASRRWAQRWRSR